MALSLVQNIQMTIRGTRFFINQKSLSLLKERNLCISSGLRCEETAEDNSNNKVSLTNKPVFDREIDTRPVPKRGTDITAIIPVEKSIRYLESKAYRETYGDKPVWVLFRRNFKGQFPPVTTRKACIVHGKVATGSPCPICRDEYLVIHHTNVKLLEQFICPYSGQIFPVKKTSICQKKHFELLVAIEKAQDCGLLKFDVPFRTYRYQDYYPQLQNME